MTGERQRETLLVPIGDQDFEAQGISGRMLAQCRAVERLGVSTVSTGYVLSVGCDDSLLPPQPIAKAETAKTIGRKRARQTILSRG